MRKTKQQELNKPIIETMMNTAALTLTAFGVTTITSLTGFPIWQGYIAILFGMGLEFFKYLGRNKYLW